MSLMETPVAFGGFRGTVSLNEPFLRYPDNPILTCHEVNEVWASDPRFNTYTVHNAGVAEVAGPDGASQIALLFRSHIADGRSVIGRAVSSNGLTDWRVDHKPFLLPAIEDDEF